jgi:hypothetical protein
VKALVCTFAALSLPALAQLVAVEPKPDQNIIVCMDRVFLQATACIQPGCLVPIQHCQPKQESSQQQAATPVALPVVVPSELPKK